MFIGKKTTNIDKGLNYKDNIPKWIDENRAFDVYMLKVNIIYIVNHMKYNYFIHFQMILFSSHPRHYTRYNQSPKTISLKDNF